MRQLFLARTHVARLNTPPICICIPLCLVDRCVKPAVGAQAVLVDNTMHIFQNFRLRGERSIPVRFWVSGEGVEVDWDVGAASLDQNVNVRRRIRCRNGTAARDICCPDWSRERVNGTRKTRLRLTLHVPPMSAPRSKIYAITSHSNLCGVLTHANSPQSCSISISSSGRWRQRAPQSYEPKYSLRALHVCRRMSIPCADNSDPEIWIWF